MILEFERNLHEMESRVGELEKRFEAGDKTVKEELSALQNEMHKEKHKLYSGLDPWQRVQLARHPKRPYLDDYIPRIFDEFMELHGDRAYSDDGAVVGGMAFIGSHSVMVIGHRKGRSLKESMERNFGMPHPEGYRKALRLMKLAEQYQMPVLSFVDTPGAYPGIGAEERGQSEAIARNLRDMSVLKVPIIVTVLAEGGSGGALAIGVGDAVLMLENAWYSVISPEGCAAILFHDSSQAPMAASALKLTATDLLGFKIIDDIVSEPLGGAQKDPDEAARNIKEALLRHLDRLAAEPVEKLLENRFQKFRSIGAWQERKSRAARRPKKKSS